MLGLIAFQMNTANVQINNKSINTFPEGKKKRLLCTSFSDSNIVTIAKPDHNRQ